MGKIISRLLALPDMVKHSVFPWGLILMELMAFRSYRSPDLEIRYWRTSTGQEVDFLSNNRDVGAASERRLHGAPAPSGF